MFRFDVFDHLCDDAVRIRQEVFVEEQGFVEEFDEKDAAAIHIVMYEDDSPVAVCRLIPGDDGHCCMVGRIAVVRSCRGRSLGSSILDEAERRARLMGFDTMRLSAQVRARGFYERCGYSVCGEEYLEEWCPHVLMCKSLRERFRHVGADIRDSTRFPCSL